VVASHDKRLLKVCIVPVLRLRSFQVPRPPWQNEYYDFKFAEKQYSSIN
jgi:hypothetical protein